MLTSFQVWTTLVRFCTHSEDAKQQASRTQSVIRNIVLFAFNVAKHSMDQSPSSEDSQLLFDAADKPLWQKPATKRKAIDCLVSDSKKSKNSSSFETLEHTETLKRSTSAKHTTPPEQTTCPVQVAPPTTHEASLGIVANSTNNRTILQPTALPLTRVSPSGRANDWLQTWTSIIKPIPPNIRTGKAAAWPSLLTKVLVHTFGYDGVNNVITMVEQVFKNYDIFTIEQVCLLHDLTKPETLPNRDAQYSQ
jgi:hypothetical protein